VLKHARESAGLNQGRSGDPGQIGRKK
jgi:hypothetical protein